MSHCSAKFECLLFLVVFFSSKHLSWLGRSRVGNQKPCFFKLSKVLFGLCRPFKQVPTMLAVSSPLTRLLQGVLGNALGIFFLMPSRVCSLFRLAWFPDLHQFQNPNSSPFFTSNGFTSGAAFGRHRFPAWEHVAYIGLLSASLSQ